ncbi:MAG: hypothetical protein RR327_04335 [Clostridia bacterium]
MDNPKIYVAFRFQVEMSRSDETDASAIEKDLRTFNHCIRALNVVNAKGVDVKGTWSIEKDLSYDKIMPKYCVEMLEKINERLNNGDELEFTSPSNVMLTALDNKECQYVLKKCVKKNVDDIDYAFNKTAPIFRPCNEMLSPSLIPFFKSVGMSAVSMYYSNSACSSFTNLIEPLPIDQRYNPILYKNPTTEESITLLPSVNAVDLMSNFGIKRTLRKMRKSQMALEKPTDLLLLIDAPFQDEFWYGYFSIRRENEKSNKMTYGGLYRMISLLEKIDYVSFTTPYEYLKTHQTIGEMKIPHDLANGSFEGYSSFAEKWENTLLFKDVESARYNAYVAVGLAKQNNIDIEKESVEALEKRIDALNAAYYGKNAPKVNSNRLSEGVEKASLALKSSIELLNKANIKNEKEQSNKLKLYVDNPYLYLSDGASGVVFVNSEKNVEHKYALNGKILRSFKLPNQKTDGIILNKARGTIELEKMPCDQIDVVKSDLKRIENEQIKLVLLPSGAIKLIYKNEEFIKRAFKPTIKYKGKIVSGEIVETENYNLGDVQVLKVIGEIKIKKIRSFYEYSFTIVNGVPAVYFDGVISYPKTEEKKNMVAGKASSDPFDANYEEIMPFEISLSMKATDKKPYKIVKQNFFGEQSIVSLNNGKVSKNRHLDSFNSLVTAGYVAVSNGEKGILLTESVEKDFNFAFCPMRLSYALGDYSLKLNPFGTYFGKQRKNSLTRSGLSNILSKKLCKTFYSQGASYNGKTTEVSMMIAPYFGEMPSEELIKTAMLSAYPPKQI